MLSTRRYRTLAAGLAVVAVLVLLSGPRVSMEASIRPLELPRDIDGYLAQRETARDCLVHGTEKRIDWAGKPGTQTRLAVVYLHGFSASRQDTAPFAQLLSKGLDANLFATRLTGHGCGSTAMLEGSVHAWLDDAHEAVEIGKRLGQRVVLVGTSTGATLAVLCAARDQRDIAALVLLSPNFGPAVRRTAILTWPWGMHLAELFAGRERKLPQVNEAFAKFWTTRYPVRALAPMMGLVNLAASLDLARITVPAMIIYSPNDRILDTRQIRSAFLRLGSTDKHLLPYMTAEDPDQHILAGDIISPAATAPLAALALEFLASSIR